MSDLPSDASGPVPQIGRVQSFGNLGCLGCRSRGSSGQVLLKVDEGPEKVARTSIKTKMVRIAVLLRLSISVRIG